MAGLDASRQQQLLAAARQAATQAYAPYSRFPVGAALLLADGTVVTGCNVENVSYGLTLCAERTAVIKAVSDGHKKFQALAVWAEAMPNGGVTPCGACRQVLAEFFAPETPIIFADKTSGQPVVMTLSALLPAAFADTGNSTPGAPR